MNETSAHGGESDFDETDPPEEDMPSVDSKTLDEDRFLPTAEFRRAHASRCRHLGRRRGEDPRRVTPPPARALAGEGPG